MRKAISYIKGLNLLVRHFRAFDFSILKGKRIALVGPADSAYNTDKGEYIDGFDFVVRVNRAPYIVASGKHMKDIGSRTDILYHSFFENDESGGGVLDLEMYKKQGLKYLINPRNSKLGYQTSLVFYRKYNLRQDVFTLDSRLHKTICKPLGKSRPTIGYMALMSLLMADFSELYITGFTFYRTDFGAGYRDHIKDKDDAKTFINKMGIHEIEKEYCLFKKEVDLIRSKNRIVLDSVLSSILENE
ncbi:glycosyltransferase family 29 protein [Algoriphagus sp. C2-6-M1]|uniref:glycosyltransferase family 29 protein n=1 Tax=Algoriphagus persicinus TaxID=3108754 RepID=UPI002B3DAFAE|nr:glycosyltransferase family 29 protein [Algoriphagus sp. C2-6-M1]MEB2782434.1 glycosyltransferase family 29 protein [Algoriphagus sp. C2-6-M1]